MPIKAEKLVTSVPVPEGVTVSLNRHMLVVDGPRGRAIKSFRKIPVNIGVSGDAVSLRAGGSRKRDYAILNTARSLVGNLCQGVVEGYTVKMKIVYAHFPVTVQEKDDEIAALKNDNIRLTGEVKVQGDSVLIENFQGERAPRVARIHGSAKVDPQGDDVIVTGHVLTDVTQTAANIQLKTRIKNKDHRVFLDGIYVYDKRTGTD